MQRRGLDMGAAAERGGGSSRSEHIPWVRAMQHDQAACARPRLARFRSQVLLSPHACQVCHPCGRSSQLVAYLRYSAVLGEKLSKRETSYIDYARMCATAYAADPELVEVSFRSKCGCKCRSGQGIVQRGSLSLRSAAAADLDHWIPAVPWHRQPPLIYHPISPCAIRDAGCRRRPGTVPEA
jgi:hypothetical protein